MHHPVSVISALLLATLTGSSLVAASRLTIRLSTQFATAPATVLAYTRVEPDTHNRQLCIEWESEYLTSRDCRQLDGVEARARYTVTLRRLPEGVYTVAARVTQNDGKVLKVVAPTLTVFEGPPQGEPIFK